MDSSKMTESTDKFIRFDDGTDYEMAIEWLEHLGIKFPEKEETK